MNERGVIAFARVGVGLDKCLKRNVISELLQCLHVGVIEHVGEMATGVVDGLHTLYGTVTRDI